MSDTAYMDAVRRGDLSTAQRLVDAAAKKAGYTIKVFHGSSAKFTKPNMPLFLGDEETAMTYAQDRSMMYGVGSKPTIYRLYAKFKKTASEDMVKEVANDLGLEVENDMAYSILDPQISAGKSPKIIQELKKLGYDSAKIDDFSASNATEVIQSFVAFDPGQLKLTDPVTYDDAGNVIPLSERFSDQSDDIRNPRTAPKQFPYEYAAYLKAHFPAIWAAGGNIRGNDTFRWWTAYRRGDRSPTVMRWWNVTRPAWIARHYRDYRLPGVIAQIKWGTVGTLGVAGMKRVVEDAIRKKY